MPAVIDAPGWYVATTTVYALNTSATVGCMVEGVNAAANWHWFEPMLYVQSFGSDQQISTKGAYVPAGGQLYIHCEVGPGSWIKGTTWALQ
ncbi:hypothetical protein DRW03_34860 [Corallococcus sp. H22C18031201]|nr:hypothetical protein DRW03_34860 [Corallococcus sp. H22C18031201]